jgi:hypothetical protein
MVKCPAKIANQTKPYCAVGEAGKGLSRRRGRFIRADNANSIDDQGAGAGTCWSISSPQGRWRAEPTDRVDLSQSMRGVISTILLAIAIASASAAWVRSASAAGDTYVDAATRLRTGDRVTMSKMTDYKIVADPNLGYKSVMRRYEFDCNSQTLSHSVRPSAQICASVCIDSAMWDSCVSVRTDRLHRFLIIRNGFLRRCTG